MKFDSPCAGGEKGGEVPGETIRVTAYTGGRSVPGARFRVRQYLPALRARGVGVREIYSRAGAYPPAAALVRPFWGLGNLAEHAVTVAASYRTDVTWLQREFLSTFFTLEPALKRPIVLDVDDAVWMHRDGRCARRLARLANSVICGNDFLADWFSRWNDNVVVIPTPVDTERFRPHRSEGGRERVTMVWSGSASNLSYVTDIEDALCAVLDAHPEAVLRVMADAPPRWRRIPPGRAEYLRWNENDEIPFIQQGDIGLMPLRDGPWERGKCSFKMISYMACALPVVASEVGMNSDVLRRGALGLGARTADDWIGALGQLIREPALRESMGKEGRRVAEAHYSVSVNAEPLEQALRAAAREARGR